MPETVSPLSNPAAAELPEPGEAAAAAQPEPGVGLCLSGGGYRAMLFHLGALWRLNELGLLPKLKRVSSVSGGSITAALLGLAWGGLGFDAGGVAQEFGRRVVGPIRALAGKTIDVGSVLGGLLNPFSSISDNVHDAYREHLYGDATLQHLPDPPAPRFVLNATNVQTGALWRFSKPFMGDYRVGLTMAPPTSLALAVTASSAFPPFLSPLWLKLSPDQFMADTLGDLGEEPYTTEAVLTDGGVYDNLGVTPFVTHRETWGCDTVLVSDASRPSDWATLTGPWTLRSYIKGLARSYGIAADRLCARDKETVSSRPYVQLPITHVGGRSKFISEAHRHHLKSVPTDLDALPIHVIRALVIHGQLVAKEMLDAEGF